MTLTRKQKKTLTRILLSGAMLASLMILDACGVLPGEWYISLPLFLVPYFAAGWDVLFRAVRNVFHGQWLDENFLMSLATVGALVLGEYPEAVFVMLFYQVGELFQSIAVGRSRRSISELMKIRPDEARVLRGGAETAVDPEEVAVGELLIVRPGEKIALDGVVEAGESDLDTVSLTGETLPRRVLPGAEVLSGCVNVSGLLKIRVTKPYGESTVTKILELVERSTLVKSKAEQAVTRFARWYTPAVVAGAVLLAVVPSLFLPAEWQRFLRSALIFLVVSCPCALVISVPLSYFSGIGKASRRGILVKGANYLDVLSRADTVVFDKTGTLTEGVFAVTGILPAEGRGEEEVLSLAAAAEQNSNHPIAQSLRAAAKERRISFGETEDAAEEVAGKGIRAVYAGKPLLVGTPGLLGEAGIACPEFAGAAGTVVCVAYDGTYRGGIVISDRVKPDAKEAVDALRALGIRRTVMLSGDRADAVRRVAESVGIDEYRAELLPAGKVDETERLLAEKHGSLVFVGDGVNDAPVLARADAGIAMGALGSDAAIEAADLVLMDDHPGKIAEALRISRRTRTVVRENVVFALTVKAAFLVLGALGLTGLWAASFADVGVAVIAILNAMRAG